MKFLSLMTFNSVHDLTGEVLPLVAYWVTGLAKIMIVLKKIKKLDFFI